MHLLEKKLDKFIKERPELVIPKKVPGGILLGNVLIRNKSTLKELVRENKIIYNDINLNNVAIALAKCVFLNKNIPRQQQLTKLDQEYGRWLNEAKFFNIRHRQAVKQSDLFRAGVMEARWLDAKMRADILRRKADSLALSTINKI
jgi:hypothetical protein